MTEAKGNPAADDPRIAEDAAPVALRAAPPPAGASRMLAEYHSTMRMFLSVQEQLMMTLLGRGNGAPRVPPPLRPVTPPETAEMPPATVAPAVDAGASLLRPLARYVMRPHAEPLPADAAAHLPAGAYLILPDHLGVAAALSRRLETAGATPRVAPEEALASDDAFDRWLATVRAAGRFRGLVDLRPLRRSGPADWLDLAAWRGAIARDLKALFVPLRLAAADLASDGVVVVGSGMGGCFARDAIDDPQHREVFPGQGGAVGLVKSLSLEWPGCRCKAIDLDPAEAPERLAAHLHAELTYPGGRREVGYPRGIRTIFRTEPESLIPLAEPLARPDENWVVLAIGGARGITAETLRDFAAARATCVIVGRSPLPEPAEDAATGSLAGTAELRAHFLAAARNAGQRLSPAAIEGQIAALLRDREMRANVADFAAAGATVDYRQLDMRQEADAAALIEAIYERYGRLDAVLFGAGLIEDRLLVDKTPDSLARVVDTKVDGAFLIARLLRPETLKFVVFFTSVAGRYGNRGQSDYAAANEVLNRLAWLLQAKWGPHVKVCAINWGPWSHTTHGAGMLTPETARQFRERGVELIGPQEGRGFLLRELLYAPRDQVEVVAGEHPWEYRETELAAGGSGFAPQPPALPLLSGREPVSSDATGRTITKLVDLVSDPYLDDHRIDRRPVIPLACAAEYMAEAAVLLGGAGVCALSEVRMLSGLVVREPPLAVALTVRSQTDGAAATVELASGQPRRRLAYRATAQYGEPAAPPPSVLLARPVAPSPFDMAAAYRNWLFTGPRLQTIREIIAMDRERIVARAVATRPGDFYPPAAGCDWIFDPGLVDGAEQLAWTWLIRERGMPFLPAAIGHLVRYGEAPISGEVTLAVQIVEGWIGTALRFRFEVVDAAGQTRLAADDFEGVIDPGLNRLRGHWAGGSPPADAAPVSAA